MFDRGKLIAEQSEPINLARLGLALEVHDIVPNEPGAVDFVSELRPAPVAERLGPTEELLDGEHCPVVPEAKLLRALREEDLGAIPLSAPVTKELVQAFLLRCERERVVEKRATNALELGEAHPKE